MPKFTPRPWVIIEQEECTMGRVTFRRICRESQYGPVELCLNSNHERAEEAEERRATAVLISKAPEMYAHLKEMTEADDLFPAGEDGERNGVYECRWCGREYHEDDGTWNETPRFCPEETCPGHQIRTLLAEIEG